MAKQPKITSFFNYSPTSAPKKVVSSNVEEEEDAKTFEADVNDENHDHKKNQPPDKLVEMKEQAKATSSPKGKDKLNGGDVQMVELDDEDVDADNDNDDDDNDNTDVEEIVKEDLRDSEEDVKDVSKIEDDWEDSDDEAVQKPRMKRPVNRFSDSPPPDSRIVKKKITPKRGQIVKKTPIRANNNKIQDGIIGMKVRSPNQANETIVVNID